MINIFNLNYKRDEKEIKKVETYRKILIKIHSKIKLNSNKSLTHLVYFDVTCMQFDITWGGDLAHQTGFHRGVIIMKCGVHNLITLAITCYELL